MAERPRPGTSDVGPVRPAPMRPGSAPPRPQKAQDSKGRNIHELLHDQHASKLKKLEDSKRQKEVDEIRQADELVSRTIRAGRDEQIDAASARLYRDADVRHKRLEERKKDQDQRYDKDIEDRRKQLLAHPLNESVPPDLRPSCAKPRWEQLNELAPARERLLEEKRKVEIATQERFVLENSVHNAKARGTSPFDRLHAAESEYMKQQKVAELMEEELQEIDELASRTVRAAPEIEGQKAGERMFKEAEERQRRLEKRRKDQEDSIVKASAPKTPSPPRTKASSQTDLSRKEASPARVALPRKDGTPPRRKDGTPPRMAPAEPRKDGTPPRMPPAEPRKVVDRSALGPRRPEVGDRRSVTSGSPLRSAGSITAPRAQASPPRSRPSSASVSKQAAAKEASPPPVYRKASPPPSSKRK